LADARRYAEEALAWAPHDLALRADLARALLLLGDEAGARAHARIIDGSDPAEKQSARSGNEWQNSIAALHMELADRAEAARDARRLLLGSLTERGQGSLILASIAIQRGAYRAGIDRLAAQADESEAGGIDTLASNLRWRAAWAALHTGELARARELLARIRQEHWRPFRDFTLALAAARAEPRRREAHLTAAVEALEGLRPGTSGRLEAELILAHEQRTWHRVIELERALRVASRQGGQVALYFLADALEATGDRAAAAAALERLATHPRGREAPVLSVRAWRRLGEVREALGDRDGAAAAYRELIARRDLAAPDDPDLVASRRGLSRLSR